MTEAKNMVAANTMPRLLTAQEVADALQCSPRIVASWTASGELASVKLGRLRRYRPDDVGAFIRLCRQGKETHNNSRNTT